MTPQGLAILGQPALDGRTIEGHPQLVVGGAAALLNVAARIADQRRQCGILISGTTPGDPHQHGLHGGLKGRAVAAVAAAGNAGGRLIQFARASRRLTGSLAASAARHKHRIAAPRKYGFEKLLKVCAMVLS